MSADKQASTQEQIALRCLVEWRDSGRLSGAPCFTGTRVPINSLFEYLEAGDSIHDFLHDFLGVTQAQVLGALHIGKERLLEEFESDNNA